MERGRTRTVAPARRKIQEEWPNAAPARVVKRERMSAQRVLSFEPAPMHLGLALAVTDPLAADCGGTRRVRTIVAERRGCAGRPRVKTGEGGFFSR